MNSPETDRLVRRLAQDAARHRRPAPLRQALSFATIMSLATAMILCLAVFGSGIDLPRLFADPWFPVKLADMGLLAAGALAMLLDLARPEVGRVRLRLLLPAGSLLLLAAVIDPSGLPIGGRTNVSVPICLGAIIVISLPGLALILGVMHSLGAVTRPRLAGAAAGLLAGALGGMAYAFACRNDGGLFIAVWYGLAVASVAGAGALAGSRALAW